MGQAKVMAHLMGNGGRQANEVVMVILGNEKKGESVLQRILQKFLFYLFKSLRIRDIAH